MPIVVMGLFILVGLRDPLGDFLVEALDPNLHPPAVLYVHAGRASRHAAEDDQKNDEPEKEHLCLSPHCAVVVLAVRKPSPIIACAALMQGSANTLSFRVSCSRTLRSKCSSPLMISRPEPSG